MRSPRSSAAVPGELLMAVVAILWGSAFPGTRVAWFTLSLINAGLARSKGRSGFQWWLGSLFIIPFATLLIVASPAVQPGEAELRPGRMNRGQAVIIGAVILVAMFAIIGLVNLGGPAGGSGT